MELIKILQHLAAILFLCTGLYHIIKGNKADAALDWATAALIKTGV